MEEHLQQANENARPGLQRALEATKKSPDKGWKTPEKGWEKSKGKGKGLIAKGDKDDGGVVRNIQGLFKSMDGAQITVTMQVQGKDAERTFPLTREILKSLGKSSPELTAGTPLRLLLSEDEKRVIGIQPGKGRNGDDGQKDQK
jgi:hypothetical protein